MTSNKLKELMIAKFFEMVGDPDSQILYSMRWRPVLVKHAQIRGIDVESRDFKRSFASYVIVEDDLYSMEDEDFLELFELVCRRAYMQM